MKPTIISVFAGCGGSSLGYKMAGFKELLAIDFNKIAVETFKLNFDCPIWCKDISKVQTEEILKFCNIKKRELDILDGSPPCQGFSTAKGKRKITDERNNLFKEFVKLINELQPKIFVMENVSGMIKGKMKGRFIEIITILKTLNYQVKCKLMNAMYYNVPQSRERLIFIGIRNDLKKLPVFPIPRKKLITVKECLKNIQISEVPLFNDKYADLWNFVKPGKSTEKILNGTGFNTFKINPNKPSCTITKMNTGRGFATLCHWSEKRALSINEVKRIQTFSDNFKFVGTYQEQWAQIGNSVPPKFMYAIAKKLKNLFITL